MKKVEIIQKIFCREIRNKNQKENKVIKYWKRIFETY